jgi:ribose 5-phosphate isomerase A
VTFGWTFCARRLAELGCHSRRRMAGAAPFVTDNGNYILDCGVGPIPDPAGLERSIGSIPGVVGTGLFLGMADTVLLEDEQGRVTVRRRG